MYQDYHNIKKQIINSNKIIYWLNERGDILLIDYDKNISKSKIKKMNNISGSLYRFNLTFHTGKKPGQGGPIAINIRAFNKINNKINRISGYKNGVIWFPRDYLERRGWQDKYINMTFNIVTRSKFQFKIGIYKFDDLL